jgi:hypothetical protein
VNKFFFSIGMVLAAVAGCADDTGPGDAAVRPESGPDVDRDTAVSPDRPGAAEDRPDGADRPDQTEGPPIGACEPYQTIIEVKTADGKPTIASVEVNPPCQVIGVECARPPLSAAPTCQRADGGAADGGTSGGSDGGAAGCASVFIRAGSDGSCGVRITSISGEQVCAAVEIVRHVENISCRDDIGRVFTPVAYLSANPPTITVPFGNPDGGMADGGADATTTDTAPTTDAGDTSN